MGKVFYIGYASLPPTIPQDKEEILIARHPLWPRWYSSVKLKIGKEFKQASQRLERDGFDLDIHVFTPAKLKGGVLDFAGTDIIESYVLTELGPEPRIYYINAILHKLGQSQIYQDRVATYINEHKWSSAQKKLLLSIVSDKRDLPARDIAQEIDRLFAGEDLPAMFGFLNSVTFDRSNRRKSDHGLSIDDGKPRMLMNFWHLAKQDNIELVGFKRAGYYLPESVVQKQGHRIISI